MEKTEILKNAVTANEPVADHFDNIELKNHIIISFFGVINDWIGKVSSENCYVRLNDSNITYLINNNLLKIIDDIIVSPTKLL